MPEMWKAIIGSVVRWALTGYLAVVVERGVITEEQSAFLIAALVGLLATLIWGVYQKWIAHNKVIEALFTPVPESERK